ncbi:hypothetical protein ACB098_01G048200 [Castanea mollissima]|uniref:CBS domain-containing protein n=1 Tax=Castanea mollissima TaxID=60419 RepID=A0A8J4RZP2_9ROSI|nr:hypothetical protein CMV_000013 [Castanea mollissima]
MQGIFRAVRSCQETLKAAILQHSHGRGKIFTFGGTTSSSPEQLKGLENVTVAEVLMTKGEEKTGSWLWCRTDDAVIDAVKNMAKNNIGSLVVLRPGEEHLAGIITERDYTRKIVAQGRSPIYTTVGEIMTDKQDKLITVTSDTNVLQAMQLMTENQIRHIPVIDGKIVGMISIVDVVRAVVHEQSGELKRLNEFIKGDYY